MAIAKQNEFVSSEPNLIFHHLWSTIFLFWTQCARSYKGQRIALVLNKDSFVSLHANLSNKNNVCKQWCLQCCPFVVLSFKLGVFSYGTCSFRHLSKRGAKFQDAFVCSCVSRWSDLKCCTWILLLTGGKWRRANWYCTKRTAVDLLQLRNVFFLNFSGSIYRSALFLLMLLI